MSTQKLIDRGVNFLAPDSCYVAPEVNPKRIEQGVTIYPGCRLHGASLAIGAGSVIGSEGPVTISECQLGREVVLAGGFFEGSTMLDGTRAGSGSHMRPGCLFEEHAIIAHSVGVKQTVMLPWATCGSLINFCDCLMAGGTSPTNHSEVGSSYIHFNFTPLQDKATASLMGDVPRGVLLNQPPIFLGGQGGMVGPCLIEYGTVIPAGQICRSDITEPGRIVAKAPMRSSINAPFDPSQMRPLKRTLRNNLIYLGNIVALDQWYRAGRAPSMQRTVNGSYCLAGARQRLSEIMQERLFRLDELRDKISLALDHQVNREEWPEQLEFVNHWHERSRKLTELIATRDHETPPSAITRIAEELTNAPSYIEGIRQLHSDHARQITTWLQSLVNRFTDL